LLVARCSPLLPITITITVYGAHLRTRIAQWAMGQIRFWFLSLSQSSLGCWVLRVVARLYYLTLAPFRPTFHVRKNKPIST
jgi:hypothetical protein